MNKELLPPKYIEYGEIISIIERARENAFRAVNRELISMYWEIGSYVSDKVKNGGWGKSVVKCNRRGKTRINRRGCLSMHSRV
jgi:hypothetical protein